MGNSKSLFQYVKYNNNKEVSLCIDMYNSGIALNYRPNNIYTYGINTKISLLSILSNLLNIPNQKIESDRDKPDIKKMYDTLKENIIRHLESTIYKIDKIIHYNDNLEIRIGKYIFKLIAKRLYSKDDRLQLLLSSRKLDNTNERMMIYYRSNSEGGLWRFAVQELPTSRFRGGYMKYGTNLPKGNIDYITETNINMELQQFIYENLYKVPYSYYDNGNNLSIQRLSSSIGKTFYTESNIDATEINKYIANFNNINELFFNFRRDYDDIQYPYFNILRYHIGCGNPINYERLLNMKRHFFTIPTNKYTRIMYNKINNELPDGHVKSRIINYHRTYYTILSNYLREIGLNYDNSTCKYLYWHRTTIGHIKDDEYKFDTNNYYYSINVNVGTDRFKLYFVVNSPKIYGKRITGGPDTVYKNIINIVPIDNDIQLTGQNTQILSMGNYICKIVEYYNPPQTSINSSSTSSESCEKDWKDIKIDDEYVFVGHCSSDVYPLRDIKLPQNPNIIPPGEQESLLYNPPF
jgi:hypothetical protein